jgi:homoserine dehydrogenase
MRDSIVVLKFGSSVLADERDFPAVILEIYREVRAGRRVVAVVSALGDTTDELLSAARQSWDDPDPACLARLLETGEAQSAAKLGLALAQAGVPARVLDPVQIGLRTTDDFLDAEPLSFEAEVVRATLAEVPVVVVPGFSGRDSRGLPALLGRGGSDLTALFLARGLEADECRLLKDVDGLLRVHPDGKLDHGTRYATASYAECLRVGGPLIQPKAVEYAQAARQSFRIACCGSDAGTLAGPVPDRFEPVIQPRGLRVGLAGLGTVGLGVLRWLTALAPAFRVTGILVRDGKRPRPEDVPAGLVTTSLDTLLASDPDLVIEVMGGTDTALQLLQRARLRGIPVVTANKQLLAVRPDLAVDDFLLAGSASVGGSVPALETVARLAEGSGVASIEGIINGTCNFILDQVNRGKSYQEALTEAQLRGLAEADPHLDVSGLDCVYKLALLAGRAFGQLIEPEDIFLEGLAGATSARVAAAHQTGAELKLVARAWSEDGQVQARVQLEEVMPDHPLSDCRQEKNRLVVTTLDCRRITVGGKGAGRWPTTVSVLSDVLDRKRRDFRRCTLANQVANPGRGPHDLDSSP